MIKLRPLLISCAIAAAACALSLSARAQPGADHWGAMPPPPMHHGGPGEGFPDRAGPPLPPFFHGLKLSEEQQDKAFNILHAQAPQMRQQAKALQKAREELRKLALSGQYDEARAKPLADAVARSTGAMALQQARTDAELAALLTPEQRKEMEAGAARRGERPPMGR